ncbi:Chitotriosidase-1 [Araneus ventricosus]|uniref:Chitotriosidase-1 n=1 Tax=Araneus ventricosus TaxID=182803 RepID=A0A4Y2HM80_ARAVE|nr:Chitotriosidase-1 [Araneus ventricosus]
MFTELKQALAPRGLLLSAAVSASKYVIDTAYYIPGVAKYVDFINVMTYDLHGSWDNTTGHTAPLYAGSDGSKSDKILTVDYAIKYWVRNGAPKSKIILGMGTHGRSFTLANAANNGLGAPSTGPGSAGSITGKAGLLGYNEICRDKGWREVFAGNIQAPYAYKGNQWVGYDNVKSIGIKVDYLIREGLGGGMIWSLETDDFRGICGGGKYPLLTTIASKLKGKIQAPDPKRKTITRPALVPIITRPVVVPTTTQRRQEFSCTKEGYSRDPSNCSVFYYCKPRVQNAFYKYNFNCPGGTAYDSSLLVCKWKNKVPGCA